MRAIERAGCHPGGDVAISLDIAASEFGREGRYTLGLEGRELDSAALSEMLLDWIERYPIVSIEDPLTEDVAIAHLAVGWNAGQLKVGSFARSERLAKWNEVLRIADALGDDARFAGTTLLPARK